VARASAPGEPDEERRVIAAQVEDVVFVNLYVINGQEVGAAALLRQARLAGGGARVDPQNYSMEEKLVVAAT